jgi:hypothetical protein
MVVFSRHWGHASVAGREHHQFEIVDIADDRRLPLHDFSIHGWTFDPPVIESDPSGWIAPRRLAHVRISSASLVLTCDA